MKEIVRRAAILLVVLAPIAPGAGLVKAQEPGFGIPRECVPNSQQSGGHSVYRLDDLPVFGGHSVDRLDGQPLSVGVPVDMTIISPSPSSDHPLVTRLQPVEACAPTSPSRTYVESQVPNNP